MARHGFHALALVVGIATILVGAVVAAFGVERIDPAVTVAAVAAGLGLAVIPWPTIRRRGVGGDDPRRHDDMT